MEHITLRVPEHDLHQVEQIRMKLEKVSGIPVNRADVLRLLLSKGIELLTDPEGKRDADPVL